MSRIFNKNTSRTKEQILAQRFAGARVTLYIISALTVINVLSLLFNGSYYFFISASVPYVLVAVGMVFCGVLPEEIASDFAHLQIFDQSIFAMFIILAVAFIALYLMCAIFSKKGSVGWLITALVLFCIDTVLMFLYFGFSGDMIIDAIFHIYIVVTLSISIYSYFKLKKLPNEEPLQEVVQADGAVLNENLYDSPVLRNADFSVKSRTLLECDFLNHKVLYRRVKKVNELVIDGKVYAEYVSRMEFNHALFAIVDGHKFVAGLENNLSFIEVDGAVLKQKLRWI